MNASQAEAAAKLNGQEFGGSTLTVQIAKDSPKPDAKPKADAKPTEKKQKPEKKDEPKKASAGMFSILRLVNREQANCCKIKKKTLLPV